MAKMCLAMINDDELELITKYYMSIWPCSRPHPRPCMRTYVRTYLAKLSIYGQSYSCTLRSGFSKSNQMMTLEHFQILLDCRLDCPEVQHGYHVKAGITQGFLATPSSGMNFAARVHQSLKH